MQHRYHDMDLDFHGAETPASIVYVCDCDENVSLVSIQIEVRGAGYYLPGFMVTLYNDNESITDALVAAAKREDWSNNIKRRVA